LSRRRLSDITIYLVACAYESTLMRASVSVSERSMIRLLFRSNPSSKFIPMPSWTELSEVGSDTSFPECGGRDRVGGCVGEGRTVQGVNNRNNIYIQEHTNPQTTCFSWKSLDLGSLVTERGGEPGRRETHIALVVESSTWT
jgi:hypothetical protein